MLTCELGTKMEMGSTPSTPCGAGGGVDSLMVADCKGGGGIMRGRDKGKPDSSLDVWREVRLVLGNRGR